jgi:hypothetical protein
MNQDLWQFGSRNEIVKPAHYAIWMDRRAVVLCKNPVAIIPPITYGCTIIAKCVDHIVPVKGTGDPLFFVASNHQSVYLHCNSVKQKQTIKGAWELQDEC